MPSSRQQSQFMIDLPVGASPCGLPVDIPSRDISSCGSGANQAHLLWLVGRIAIEDHNAFADLYDELSPDLLQELELTTADPAHAAAISAATFVEVWALARFHATPDTDVQDWIADIVARRTADRRSEPTGDRPATTVSSSGRPWWSAAATSHDRHTQLALRSLLVRTPAR
jgi:DNA-directed RNA polymerase specialized sigma24 family protein